MSEEKQLKEQALKCDPETETAQMIKEAGYDTKPSTEAVDESLYCDLLMDSLNKQAGVAHVDRIQGIADEVQVTFSLPFGGSFTRRYERPEQRSHENPSIQKLFQVTDGSLDDLTGAIDRPVYITKDGHDGWEVNHEIRPSFDEETDLEKRQAHKQLRRRLAVTVGGVTAVVGAVSVLLHVEQTALPEALLVGGLVALFASFAITLIMNYDYMRRAAKVIAND